MVELLVLVLIAVVAKLWHDVTALRRRIDRLDQPTPAVPAEPEERPALRPVAIPAPVVREVLQPAEPEPTPEPRRRPTLNLEELFGRQLPIWAGGLTLAVAGFLIVKYSIDTGLLSPAARVIAGLVFGTALIGGAEAARHWHQRVPDPSIAQALAGAGLSTLYASVLVAANLYNLIPPGLAFTGLAIVTALAAGLSLRFGAPSAVLGLLGGLAAPALVGSASPNVPLLAAYLALAVGGLSVLGRGRGWSWLAAGALTGGFGWGAALIVGGALDATATLSVGVLLTVFAAAIPAFAMAGVPRLGRVAAGVAGAAQMAALVATGGFTPLGWELFGLISLALLWLARREPSLRELPPIGLTVALLLATVWSDPSPAMLTAVLGGVAILYGGAALMRLWRGGGLVEAAQILAVSVALPLLPLLHLELSPAIATALGLLGAAVSGGAAALGWRTEDRIADARFAMLAGGSGVLLVLAAELVGPHWSTAPVAALVATGLLWLSGRAGDRRIEWTAIAGAVLSLLLLLADERGLTEIARATGKPLAVSLLAIVRWGAFAALAAFGLLRAVRPFTRRAAALVIPPALGVALAPLLPVAALPLIPAALLALGAWWRPAGGEHRLVIASAAGIALAWAVEPLTRWTVGAGQAIVGVPMIAGDVASPLTTLIHLILPVAAGLAVLWRLPLRPDLHRIGWAVVGSVSTVALHSLYQRAVGMNEVNFAVLSLWERSGWEALLAAGALAAWRLGQGRAALALGAVSLTHFAWFTGMLHNPLWTGQLAPLPALFLAYGLALALLWWSPKLITSSLTLRARDWALMAAVLLFATSLLRWAFHGPLLSPPGVTAAEDVARSVGLIALAVAYLRTGLVQARIEWRLGSLVIMLAAVSKVFLIDAAGLDGLARIGAFAALGFSLLGVGWLYSRVLRTGPAPEVETA